MSRTCVAIEACVALALVCGCVTDPSPGVWRTNAESRNLECRRMTQERGHELYPAAVPEVRPRELAGRVGEVLVCEGRMVALTDRMPRDEAMLMSLRQSVAEIVERATKSRSSKATWYVDAFYPDPRVSQKVAVAARVELTERGHRVSDRVPMLAAGDIAVLNEFQPKDMYRFACQRYQREELLTPDELFLGLMVFDARESQLHAGLCENGNWRWLQ